MVWHPERTAVGAGFWCVTRHADVVEVNRDCRAISTARAGIMIFDRPELADPATPRMMIEMDPPQHTRYRLLVNRGFTPRMIGSSRSSCVASRRAPSTGSIDRGEADFVEDVAAELPIQVIAQLMGVPDEDRPKLFELSNRIIGFDEPEYGGEGRPSGRRRRWSRCTRSRTGSARAKRAELDAGEPAGDIVSALLEAEVDGDRLTELEYDMFFLLLTVAGNETTRTAIAQGMLAFIEHPEQWERVRADRSLLPTAVDEILRYSTPILHFRRTATRATSRSAAKPWPRATRS